MSQNLKPILDPRLHAWRDDLAAAYLKSEVKVDKFVSGETHYVKTDYADLHRMPAPSAPRDSQLLYGERFRVYDVKAGWAWGQSQHDDYVGYMRTTNLQKIGDKKTKPPQITHYVHVLRSYIYADPDIKSRILGLVSIGAQLSVTQQDKKFAQAHSGGYILTDHISAQNQTHKDYIATALKFTHTPYLWGGRTSLGLDCSALIQLSLHCAGMACPRDSDMQEACLGRPLKEGEAPQKGDIVFWAGHVGFLSAPDKLLHATAHYMQVVEEDFSQACARIERQAGPPVSSIKRL